MKWILFCWLALLCLVNTCLAQSSPQKINSLPIGAQVPGIKFTQLYNHSAPAMSLKDFKGKMIILDFWTTWCGSCIEAFPKLLALQKEFKQELKVILVNDQSDMNQNKLQAFYEKRKAKAGQLIDLLTVYGDTLLKQYFPHKGLPHCVWIDPQGRVAAITYPEEVNAANIRQMLSGKIRLGQTKNDALLFDKNIPLLTGGNGDPAAFLFRSVITGPLEHMGTLGGRVSDDSGKITRFYDMNTGLLSLFQTAYPDVFRNAEKRTVVEVPVDLKGIYCYELITPPITQAELQRCMQEDLYRYFKVVAKKETRPVACYNVIANANLPKYYSRHDTAASELGTDALKKYLYKCSIDELLKQLGGGFDRLVFNETGITQPVDLDLPVDIYNYTPLQLRRYFFEIGLTLVETTKQMEVAVLCPGEIQPASSTTFINH